MRGSSPDTFTPGFIIKKADNFIDKLIGLMGKQRSDHALLLTKCTSIHTFFMFFPIHVLFLDEDFNVLEVITAMKPCNFACASSKARHTLEIPVSLMQSPDILIGRQLSISKSF